MTTETYTKLFGANRRMVDQGSCSVMNNLREEALASLSRSGLPDASLEEYLHTDVAKWFEPDWGMNLNRLELPVSLKSGFRCSVPNLSTALYYLADDRFVPSADVALPEGVVAGGLCDVARSMPGVAERYYGQIADMKRPGIAALNTLFAQDGFMVYVPEGLTVDKPLQLISLLQSPVDMMVTRRLLVVLGRGASLKLLLCDHASDRHSYLTTQVTEVFAGEGARLDMYDLEETGPNVNRVSELFLKQESDSMVNMLTMTLNNGRTRNSCHAYLAGRGSALNLDGIAIANGSQHIDNYTFVDHQVPDCQSSELFKYVLGECATGAFAGKVLVRPDSQRTVSHQTNRNICLTRSARMFTQPQLEIYADDVKCSHGATVGQLDERALFYMRQRGIPEEEARTLLMTAFAGEVLDRVTLGPLQQRLRHLVERRFRFGNNICDDCHICNR
ncbi:MAG: Fe-S cluster assembly protein SufD [Bacteroidaceae bacterium]|nr:Fe-S cluster assembly protein SufD [Bacteroidaceae bacterium]